MNRARMQVDIWPAGAHRYTCRRLRAVTSALRIERINVDAGPKMRRVAKKVLCDGNQLEVGADFRSVRPAQWLASIECDRLGSLMKAVVDHFERPRQLEDSLEPADPHRFGEQGQHPVSEDSAAGTFVPNRLAAVRVII
ncbi:hypothetical protein, partial [Ralstonia pseudosolanacearum]|uniref:hypothetical protein n=1 Tax=Ralstonia pseudosolanacearum TaxID=1310165 RepID=UPI003CF73203